MTRPTCDVCGRPATVHETVATSDSDRRHYCRDHGLLVWREALAWAERAAATHRPRSPRRDSE